MLACAAEWMSLLLFDQPSAGSCILYPRFAWGPSTVLKKRARKGALPASALVTIINDDGSWNWFQDERVIVTAGKLIVGSVADGIHDTTRAGNVEVVS